MAKVVRIIGFQSEDYDAEMALRYEILRKPLGLEFRHEDLQHESISTHIGCFHDGKLVGCLLMTPKDERIFQMRQVAVAQRFQRQGIGEQLVEFAEQWARQEKANKIILNAREAAIPFYLKLNYQTVGTPFTEVRIPHSRMEKKL